MLKGIISSQFRKRAKSHRHCWITTVQNWPN